MSNIGKSIILLHEKKSFHKLNKNDHKYDIWAKGINLCKIQIFET